MSQVRDIVVYVSIQQTTLDESIQQRPTSFHPQSVDAAIQSGVVFHSCAAAT